MLAIQSQARDWDAALAILETQRKASQLSPDRAKRMRAVLLAAKALAAENARDPKSALDFALEAAQARPDFWCRAALGRDPALCRAECPAPGPGALPARAGPRPLILISLKPMPMRA